MVDAGSSHLIILRKESRMATETNNVEQYIDIEGLRQLLNLIKQTYVCQKGLTSKVREQIYSILETIGSNAVVKQTYNDTRTDPYEIAKDFRDYTWKNADLLCVENPDGHMSVFYWNNALWVCLTKAPVNEINIDDTEENLKKIVPTASAVVKIVDGKPQIQLVKKGGESLSQEEISFRSKYEDSLSYLKLKVGKNDGQEFINSLFSDYDNHSYHYYSTCIQEFNEKNLKIYSIDKQGRIYHILTSLPKKLKTLFMVK